MEIYSLDFMAYFRKHFSSCLCSQARLFLLLLHSFLLGQGRAELVVSSLLQSPAPFQQRQLQEQNVCRSQFPKWPCKPSQPDGGRKENWYQVNSAQTEQVNIKNKYSLSSFSFLKNKHFKELFRKKKKQNNKCLFLLKNTFFSYSYIKGQLN